ncbi:uncharacterized protein LOC135339690 isoform X2 [Halichondria panicea]|uniref:uncharacterized protein LOC135339690 isoform X2 n=1 Tax=Halichondria panicea TaxID=6063 RepID=UPI00312BBBAA
MGAEQGRHRHHHHDKEDSGSQPATPQDSKATAKRATVTASIPPPPEHCDVLISCANNEDDIGLVKLVKAGLESASIPLYHVSNESPEAARAAALVLVDAKVLVFVASEGSSKCGKCQDQVSLAYISNKPIVVISKNAKDPTVQLFDVGMKLTLDSLRWVIFDKDEDTISKQFVQLVQEQLNPKERTRSPAPVEASVTPSTSVPGKVRLNTKLRAQSTLREIGGEELQQINTFWDRNFSDEDTVPWFKFQQAFLTDYESQLSGLLDEKNVPWLLEMLKNDIFSGADEITKLRFMEIRGDSRDKNAFWRVISQVAIEKFNMREVFNMNSTVRLTAIEKLAAFQNPAVVDALIRLLKDDDPNVRAVAAISLGRTGRADEKVVDDLIALLKDDDRIVRQSACLSLGTLKVVKAIPEIGKRWRNDFISVVRNAARTALENMNIPEAKEVLQVTKVLEDEIESLAGNQAAV